MRIADRDCWAIDIHDTQLAKDVAELIAAAETSLATGTVRVAQTIEFEASSIIPDGTSAWAQGQATLDQPRRMHLTADFSALQLGKLEMLVDDSLVYMPGPVFDQLAGEGKWLLVDLDSSDPAAAPFKSLASGQNDVGMALAYLYGATEPSSPPRATRSTARSCGTSRRRSTSSWRGNGFRRISRRSRT